MTWRVILYASSGVTVMDKETVALSNTQRRRGCRDQPPCWRTVRPPKGSVWSGSLLHRQRPDSGRSYGPFSPSRVRTLRRARSQVRNTCWTDTQTQNTSHRSIDAERSWALSDNSSQTVLLIMLFCHACSDEPLRGIPPGLILTLAACWPTYTELFQASMRGIIVHHSSGVSFLKQGLLWTCGQVTPFRPKCCSLGTEELYYARLIPRAVLLYMAIYLSGCLFVHWHSLWGSGLGSCCMDVHRHTHTLAGWGFGFEKCKNHTNLVVLETGGLGEAVELGLVGAEAGLGAGEYRMGKIRIVLDSIEKSRILAYIYIDIGQADMLWYICQKKI